MKYFFYYKLKGIKIVITEETIHKGKVITGVFFGKQAPTGFAKAETPMIKKTALQIDQYLEGKRKRFTVPIALYGTEFQLLVWGALQTIPYGETRSYKEIAILIGKPKALRAVGMANNRNPISIIVPCHRVIGSDGNLTGYGGGLPLKQQLLELEGVNHVEQPG
jgi:methylated-DNA-[protein]-cysteine S-methyltransferase